MNKQKNIILNKVINGCFQTKDLMKEECVSREGVAFKIIFLLLTTFFSSFFIFKSVSDIEILLTLMIITSITQIILVILSFFLPIQAQKYIAVSYSVLEGLCLGAIFKILNYFYINVFPMVILAAWITFGLFLLMSLVFYKEIISVNHKLFNFIKISSIVVLFLDLFLLIFNVGLLPYIIVGTFAVIIATFSLLLDFMAVEKIVQANISKEYEWKVAFGLQITLIYIFIRIFQLIKYLGFLKERER
ncbi:MAG: Bax inhibitor-1/YccA family protein [Vigna little leaf phytoplasma]|nr:Bax inhibitor-1/YccA family protein [Vigna little leaf phytoplasma]